jgi:hypothetical protein
MDELKLPKEIVDKYRVETEIGRGASGVCYRVRSILDKNVYVMKRIHVNVIKVEKC